MSHEIDQRILDLRDDSESAVAEVRHTATLALIASGHYLSYADAKYAAQLALSGAHAREEDRPMTKSYTAALDRAREIDPNADHADGAPDCLLIDNRHADAVLALFPGAYRDDNDPPTSWTRIVLPEES